MATASALHERQPATAGKILVVGAETRLQRILRRYLETEGCRVIRPGGVEEALSATRSESPGVILIDVTPESERECREIIRVIRREQLSAIILLIGDAAVNPAHIAADLKPEEWISKPFRTRELMSRVRTEVQQSGDSEATGEVLEAAGVVLDVANRCVQVGSRFVDLTPSEVDLLAMLMSAPGRVMSRAELVDMLKGVGETRHERLIDVHINNLRSKIEADPKKPRYIRTVYGLGYRFARR